MKTILLLAALALTLTACQSPLESPRPTTGPTSPDIGTPSNYQGSAVTSPQM